MSQKFIIHADEFAVMLIVWIDREKIDFFRWKDIIMIKISGIFALLTLIIKTEKYYRWKAKIHLPWAVTM